MNDLAKPARAKEQNPFRMPAESNIFALRQQEKDEKEQARKAMRSLKVYEKGTAPIKSYVLSSQDTQPEALPVSDLPDELEEEIAANNAKDADGQRNNLKEFVARKKEMFFVQYACNIKKDEIRKLEDSALEEERRLLADEKQLEEDVAKFDAFLKENDKSSVEAIKRAEAETKAKLEKMQDIKKVNVQIASIRSEMAKNKDQLRDYRRYRDFLWQLMPKEAKANGVAPSTMVTPATPASASSKLSTKNVTAHFNTTSNETLSATESDALDLLEADIDDKTGIADYFKQPQQLLDIFSDMEEKNLSLIQTTQHLEKTLEDLRAKISVIDTQITSENATVQAQVATLQSAIAAEEEKCAVLEDRLKSFGLEAETDPKHRQDSAARLLKKVEEVYSHCIGQNDSNLDILQMLTSIENRLNFLLAAIDKLPKEKVEQAEKIKEKERRHHVRQEKLEAQRKQQEERILRAMERAKAPTVKTTGKKESFRSHIVKEKKVKDVTTKAEKSVEDDDAYFFTE